MATVVVTGLCFPHACLTSRVAAARCCCFASCGTRWSAISNQSCSVRLFCRIFVASSVRAEIFVAKTVFFLCAPPSGVVLCFYTWGWEVNRKCVNRHFYGINCDGLSCFREHDRLRSPGNVNGVSEVCSVVSVTCKDRSGMYAA